MSAEQIAAAARLWRQGYDTFAIAKKLFGWVMSLNIARRPPITRPLYTTI